MRVHSAGTNKSLGDGRYETAKVPSASDLGLTSAAVGEKRAGQHVLIAALYKDINV